MIDILTLLKSDRIEVLHLYLGMPTNHLEIQEKSPQIQFTDRDPLLVLEMVLIGTFDIPILLGMRKSTDVVPLLLRLVLLHLQIAIPAILPMALLTRNLAVAVVDPVRHVGRITTSQGVALLVSIAVERDINLRPALKGLRVRIGKDLRWEFHNPNRWEM